MSAFQWTNVKRFNFTYALNGGAWLETGKYLTSDGMKSEVNWFSFAEIEKHLGRLWIDAQLKAQGWMTGCWIDVVPVIHREPLKPVAVNGVAVNCENPFCEDGQVEEIIGEPTKDCQICSRQSAQERGGKS